MNKDNRELAAGVGPHEGRELELMLAGSKPLALFTDATSHSGYFPEEAFAPYVASGRIVMREYRHSERKPGSSSELIEFRHLYYALPDETWRIERVHELRMKTRNCRLSEIPGLEAEVGRLLGYAEWQITAYLLHASKPRASNFD